jgi:hypothetical protein
MILAKAENQQQQSKQQAINWERTLANVVAPRQVVLLQHGRDDLVEEVVELNKRRAFYSYLFAWYIIYILTRNSA